MDDRIRVLEERVAHAELARDNACAQRDEIQARAKEKVKVSSDIIMALLALLRNLEVEDPEHLELRIADILHKKR